MRKKSLQVKTVLLTIILSLTSLASKSQTLNKTIVETLAQLSTTSYNSGYAVIDNQLYYYYDSIVGVFSSSYFKLKKFNPSTNKLEAFAEFQNTRLTAGGVRLDVIGNKVIVNRAAVLPTFTGYRNWIYGGTAPNLSLIDSMDANGGNFFNAGILTLHRGINKHYLVRLSDDSIFSTDYSNPLQLEYGGTSSGMNKLNSESYKKGIVFNRKVIGTLEFNKYENGTITNIATIIASNSTNPNMYGYRQGNALYVPFGLNVYKIDTTGTITTYSNFETPVVIAKLGNSIIGVEKYITNQINYKLIGFNTITNTKFLIDSTIMQNYDPYYSRKVDNGTYCYIEVGVNGQKSIIVTDGTSTGTVITNTNTLYQTSSTLVMCGNNSMFDFNNATVGYEIASTSPNGTLTIYDEVPGGINGISPGTGFNANGTTLFTCNLGLIKLNDCDVVQTTLKKSSNNTLNIYPNPTTNSLNIEGGYGTFKLLNTLGQTVKSFSINSDKTTIDVSELTKGVYLLKSSNGITSKLIKE